MVIPVTARDVIIGALQVNDQSLTPEDKLLRANLAEKVAFGDNPAFTDGDLTLIRGAILRYTTVGMIAPVLRALGPAQ